jgi:hypothetical protein
LFDGERVQDEDTPKMLEMADGDQVEGSIPCQFHVNFVGDL